MISDEIQPWQPPPERVQVLEFLNKELKRDTQLQQKQGKFMRKRHGFQGSAWEEV